MLNHKIGISGSTLKFIAIFTMLIDHIGGILLPQYVFLRIIGRLAFPIFCFLLTEGFLHTHNLRKYLLRLGLFALISEIPFDLAIYHSPFYWWHQNVFFTLFLGLVIISGFEKYKNHTFMQLLLFILGMVISNFTHLDYGAFGIVMIVLFYLYHTHHNFIILALGIIFLNALASGIQVYGALTLIPIALYNGKRGISLKYFFYAFYPVHLLVIYLIYIILHQKLPF